MTDSVFGDVNDPEQLLGELAGAVSLCWEPRPTGVFDATAASEFVDAAIVRLKVLVSDPAIRADERAAAERDRNRTIGRLTGECERRMADLRAKVEALPDSIGRSGEAAGALIWRGAVRDLIDGGGE